MAKSETVSVRKSESILDKIRETENRIRARAYEIFSGSGFSGRDLDHWLMAEDEITLRPSMELREKGNQFKLKIAVPDVDPKAIDID
jgi:HSP20 family molecular chaperone IbpA